MTNNPKTTPSNIQKGERIAKVLARAGVASRREIERMIAEGRIRLDGKVLDTPATLVSSTDGITVDGKPAPQPESARLWRYHKPRGRVTTAKDPGGRPTVFEALPADLPRVISVGRLDINTEGLLLLTNDGALARWMELPKTGWTRRYRVRVNGTPDEKKLQALQAGITVDGVRYGAIEAKLERKQGANAWIELALKEGKNREVKRVLEHLGLKVTRLIRTAFGPFELGNLERGKVIRVSEGALRASLPDDARGGIGKDKPAPKGTGRASAKPKREPHKKPFAGGPNSPLKRRKPGLKSGKRTRS